VYVHYSSAAGVAWPSDAKLTLVYGDGCGFLKALKLGEPGLANGAVAHIVMDFPASSEEEIAAKAKKTAADEA